MFSGIFFQSAEAEAAGSAAVVVILFMTFTFASHASHTISLITGHSFLNLSQIVQAFGERPNYCGHEVFYMNMSRRLGGSGGVD